MSNITWKPHKGAQERFHTCPAFELLYGGAAGGGKSDSLIMEASKYIQHSDYKALLMRRKFTELSKADGLMDRAHKWYTALGGKWSGERRRWTFPSGAVIEFGHMEYESNKHDYQSSAYSFIGFDEVTSFAESMYVYMFSRCRSVNPKIPKIIRAATNPGNIGHAWCKKRFITNKRPYVIYEDKDGNTRCFIPATVYDNFTLMKNDPDYIKRLELLPDKERRMLLNGDWDVFEGQFFGDWDDKVHICRPFNIGRAFRFIAMDYGYSSPSSVGWFGVDEKGITYLYRELYKERLTYSELAKTILDMTSKNENIAYLVSDPKIWGDRPHHKDAMVGESGGEVMAKILGNRMTMIKGDNNRITGWGRCREYLKPYKVKGELTARFKVFDTCPEFIRTVPQQIHNEKGNIEDLDTTGEDHLADMWRYGMMSRPGVPEMQGENHILSRNELMWKMVRATLKRHKQGNDMPYIGRE